MRAAAARLSHELIMGILANRGRSPAVMWITADRDLAAIAAEQALAAGLGRDGVLPIGDRAWRLGDLLARSTDSSVRVECRYTAPGRFSDESYAGIEVVLLVLEGVCVVVVTTPMPGERPQHLRLRAGEALYLPRPGYSMRVLAGDQALFVSLHIRLEQRTVSGSPGSRPRAG